MRTIIAGSRKGATLDIVEDAMKKAPFPISVVISGTARGVDTLGEDVAHKYILPIEQYPSEWNKYGKSAGYKRNEIMADNAEALVAIWDGKSKGTKHMIDIAKRKGLLVYIHYMGESNDI